MLRVIVELVPFGDETKKRKLACMHIANISRTVISKGDTYAFAVSEKEPLGVNMFEGDVCGIIKDYNRRQPVFNIIEACLKDDGMTYVPKEAHDIVRRLMELSDNHLT